MAITEIQLFTALKHKLGEVEAQQLVEFVKTEVEEEVVTKTTHLATKEDIAITKVDLIKWIVGLWLVQMATTIGLYLKTH